MLMKMNSSIVEKKQVHFLHEQALPSSSSSLPLVHMSHSSATLIQVVEVNKRRRKKHNAISAEDDETEETAAAAQVNDNKKQMIQTTTKKRTTSKPPTTNGIIVSDNTTTQAAAISPVHQQRRRLTSQAFHLPPPPPLTCCIISQKMKLTRGSLLSCAAFLLLLFHLQAQLSAIKCDSSFPPSPASNSLPISPQHTKALEQQQQHQQQTTVDVQQLVAAGATSLQHLELAACKNKPGCLVDELAVAATSDSSHRAESHQKPPSSSSSSSWAGSGSEAGTGTGAAAVAHRSQLAADSVQIVKRNNRDFYRPSNAPANLLLASSNSGNTPRQQYLPASAAARQQVNSTQVNTAGNNLIGQEQAGQTQDTLINLKLGQILAAQQAAATTTNNNKTPAREQVPLSGDLASSASPSNRQVDHSAQREHQSAQVDRYKVVLDASSRQRLRQQLLQQQQTTTTTGGGQPVAAPALTNTQPGGEVSRFAYDRALIAAQPEPPVVGPSLTSNNSAASGHQQQQQPNRMQYSSVQFANEEPVAPSMNVSLWETPSVGSTAAGGSANPTAEGRPATAAIPTTTTATDQLLGSSSSNSLSSRQQRLLLLKFQPEDAREPEPGMRLTPSTNNNHLLLQSTQIQPQRVSLPNAASYENSITGNNNNNKQQQQLSAKSLIGGQGGCAFYDAQCNKQLRQSPTTTTSAGGAISGSSRLVRLPSISNGHFSAGTRLSRLKSNPQQTNKSPPNNNDDAAAKKGGASEFGGLGALASSNHTTYAMSGLEQLNQSHLDSTFGETGAGQAATGNINPNGYLIEAPVGTNISAASASALPALPPPPLISRDRLVQSAKQPQTPLSAATSVSAASKQAAVSSFATRLNAPRVSPLNQPLPPWSDEEIQRANNNQQQQHLAAAAGHSNANSWPRSSLRAYDTGDIPRIVNANGRLQLAQPLAPAHGFTGGISREQQRASNLTGHHQAAPQAQQHHTSLLFLPVKLIQDDNISNTQHLAPTSSSSNSMQAKVNNLTSLQYSSSGTGRVVAPQSTILFSNANQQYHTPTPYSISIMTTHMPSIFSSSSNNPHHQLSRLTNFSTFDSLPPDDQVAPFSLAPSSSSSSLAGANSVADAGASTKNRTTFTHTNNKKTSNLHLSPHTGSDHHRQVSQQHQQQHHFVQLPPKPPSAHRNKLMMLHHQNQLMNESNVSSFNSLNGFDSSSSGAAEDNAKQVRKIVRLQASPPPSPASTTRSQSHLQQQQQQIQPPASSNVVDYFQTPGDIIITSAKLSDSPASQRHLAAALGSNFSSNAASGSFLHLTPEGLATHASNQWPNQIVAAVANQHAAAAIMNNNKSNLSLINEQQQQQQQTVDFFQNRTIAEIMDDSGLRIDGQQVTFSRLKECLTEAQLLSLISQTNNAVTIFMPTDFAFQRLVQQQALAHQRVSSSTGSSSNSHSSGSARLSGRLSSAWTPETSRKYGLLPLIARMRPLGGATGAQQSSSSSSSLANLRDSSSSLDLDLSAINAGDKLTLDCSSNQVRQILLDHLSAKLITPKQLQADTSISALSGRQLLLSSVPSKKIVVVDGQPVIAATRAKNGMVYVVNKFLNLTQQMPNVIDLMGTQPNLSTFMSYLSFSSMSDRLKRETGPLTVLAPTNEAFSQLSSSARQLINSDPSALLDILRGHIVEGAQFGKLISMRNRLKTMNLDQSIEAKVVKPNIYMLDNQMTSMRLLGTTGNGVVNSIDRLIVPAWLKVSMGTKPSIASMVPENNLFTGEILDTNTANNASNNHIRHLPGISNQPLRFEQPVSRLGSSLVGNSFLLANNDNNNNLDSFDSSSKPINRNIPDSFTSTLPTTLNGNTLQGSSFFKPLIAANTNNSIMNRFNSDTYADSSFDAVPSSSPKLSANVTKNMRLIEKLAGLMQAKKFIKYLLRSRVSESLKPDMNYVILVPTDQALDKLPKQITDMLDRDMERLADLVNYHVLDTTFEFINNIPDGQTLNTLNEKDILFNWHRNNTILTASGAVVMGGIQEENIALLIVDRVLYPTPGDIMNIISKSPILSNFTMLVRSAGLEQQLSQAGPYTLFAPSDFAFNQLDRKNFELLQRDRDRARRFLLRHLSQPAIFTSSIALSNTTMVISNSLGEDLTLRQRNDYFSVNEVNFSYADVAATNGVVHVIDGSL